MANIEYKAEKLNNRNYATWKTVVKSQIMSQDLWSVVAEYKYELDEDKIKNEKAKTAMYISMNADQIAATGVCETAHELWHKIKENHEGAESNKRSLAFSEFLGLEYRRNESLVSYAGRYELLLGRLETAGTSPDEKTKLWAFSHSLPQHMMQTVHVFQMANPFGTVKQLISQLKLQYHSGKEQVEENSAFHMKTGPSNRNNVARYNNNGNNSKTTYSYQRKNKDYSRNDNQKSGANQITCNYCKKVGHKWKECRKLKADEARKKKYGQQKNNGSSNRTPQVHRGAFNASLHHFSKGKFVWIIDSRASNHMTPHLEFFRNYEQFETPHQITIGNGSQLSALGAGDIDFKSGKFEGVLQGVIYVPKLSENLFSVPRAMEYGCTVLFKKQEVHILKGRNLVLKGYKNKDVPFYVITIMPTGDRDSSACALIGGTLEDWHRRFGHCSVEVVRRMFKNGLVDGLKFNEPKGHCKVCILGKICRTHHPKRRRIPQDAIQARLHLDTVGPFRVQSLGGSRYFVLGTEQSSGYRMLETIGQKSSTSDIIKQMITEMELITGRSIKSICTDNGAEYKCKDLEDWLAKNGILHRLSVSYTPQQNGLAERANRTVIDGMRTLLCDFKLPEDLWTEAAKTVVYVLNRVVSLKKDKSPYELLLGEKPNVGNLHIFGQKAIIREPDTHRPGKLAPRGREAIFVGYTECLISISTVR